MLLHDVHFETAMLCKSRFAVRALVRLLACVRELVTFEMETVSKRFSANVAREGPLASMRPETVKISKRQARDYSPEMTPELGDLDGGVLAKGALEGLFVRVLISSVTSQFTRSNKGHFAVCFWTLLKMIHLFIGSALTL